MTRKNRIGADLSAHIRFFRVIRVPIQGLQKEPDEISSGSFNNY
jgi:hypothetical protein